MFQILLVTALCLDAFTASLALSLARTRLSPPAALVISAISTATLALSTGLGSAAGHLIPPGMTTAASFVILLLIGLVKSFEYFLKRLISGHEHREKRLQLKLFDLHLVLTVYADAEKADLDNSKTLSLKEAAYLSLALSLDGSAAGFGWGLTAEALPELLVLSLLSNLVAVTLGYFFGKLLTRVTKLDFSWLGGVILVVLAFLRLWF